MLTVMLSEKLVVKTCAAAIHAASAAAALLPKSVTKLAVKVGVIVRAKAGAVNATAQAIAVRDTIHQRRGRSKLVLGVIRWFLLFHSLQVEPRPMTRWDGAADPHLNLVA